MVLELFIHIQKKNVLFMRLLAELLTFVSKACVCRITWYKLVFIGATAVLCIDLRSVQRVTVYITIKKLIYV